MGVATARLWRGFWCRFRFWMRGGHRGLSCGRVVFRRFRFGSLDGGDIRGKGVAKLGGTSTLFYKQDGNARDAAGKSEEND